MVAAPLVVGWVTRSRDGLVRGLGAVGGGVAAFVGLRAALARPDLQHLGPIARMVPTGSLPLDASGALLMRLILPPFLKTLAGQLWHAVSPPSAPPWCVAAGAALVGVWAAGLAGTRLAWAGGALALGAWAGVFVRRIGMLPILATTDRYWYLPTLGVALLTVAGAGVSRHAVWRAVTWVALVGVLFAGVGTVRRASLAFVASSERAAAVIATYRAQMASYLERVPAGTALTFEDGFVSRLDVGPFVHREQIFRLAFPERTEVRFVWPEEGAADLAWDPLVHPHATAATPLAAQPTSPKQNVTPETTTTAATSTPTSTRAQRGARATASATKAAPGTSAGSR